MLVTRTPSWADDTIDKSDVQGSGDDSTWSRLLSDLFGGLGTSHSNPAGSFDDTQRWLDARNAAKYRAGLRDRGAER